ncbi:MAG: Smr/MutS family protein, partial [Butyrivibrio sp.]
VNIKDLEIIQEARETEKIRQKSSSIGQLKMNKTAGISAEINLIGKTADEAITELDKYLDDAFLSHLSPVRIVHGKGSGVLRNAVHNYLKRQKHVKSFRLGSFGEGDYGVTIVEFKE